MNLEEFKKDIEEKIEYERKNKPIRYRLSKLWYQIDLKRRYYNIRNGIKNLIK